MAKNILKNFITKKVRQGDIYVPSALLMLLKNDGEATITEIAKLIYIFENKHSIKQYELIVKSMVLVLLSEYSLVRVEDDRVYLNSWPLDSDDISYLIHLCYKVSNGFFRNLPTQQKEIVA